MSENYRRLREKLLELFQLDKPDLDFGIYRIMHARQAEVTKFLDEDLLPQVKQALAGYEQGNRSQIEADLAKLIENLTDAGVDPEGAPKVQELREQLAATGGADAVEGEVYDLIYRFFSRYYSEGDFISQRRYSNESTYAIPYNGEEVVLHWANKDQYYIKTSEYLRDFSFRLNPHDGADPMRVHFKLVDAEEGEHGNVKAAEGKTRVFVLAASGDSGHDFAELAEGELTLRFEYRPTNPADWPVDQRDGKSKPPAQNDMSAIAEQMVLSAPAATFSAWIASLGAHHVRTDGSTSEKSTLRAQLDRYTAKNTFDYFIHKDLGGFLRGELDFFIKNEVMHLDDIEHESAPNVEKYLAKLRAIRQVAGKIIDFLAQLEDFQKKLWLKKRFVVEVSYLLAVGSIDERFYPEICASDAQRDEWVEFLQIDKIEGDLVSPGYSVPLTNEFLSDHPYLVVDTRHLSSATTDRIVESFSDEVVSTLGLLIHGENADALRLLQSAAEAHPIACIYIDPPYNTGDDGFLYKDNYQHSSWCTLMAERLALARPFLSEAGAIAISVDEEERSALVAICDSIFGRSNRLPNITVKRASVTGHKVINPGVVAVSESVLVYAMDRPKWQGRDAFTERGRDPRYSSFVLNRDDPEDQWRFSSLLDAVSSTVGRDKSTLRKELGDRFEDVVNDFVLRNAESVFRLARVDRASVGAEFVAAVERSKLAPARVTRYRRSGHPDVYLRNGERMIFYIDKVAEVGGRRATVERASDIWTDVLPNDLHNEGGVDLPKGKKPEALLARLFEMNSAQGDLVLDFFAGTATTGAVAQKLGRRWIAIEGSTYFDEKAVRRIKNTFGGEQRGVSSAYSWAGGGVAKIVRLETYEDALNNLELQRSEEQQLLLSQPEAISLREEYTLQYMLDVESRGSQSLLNVDAFNDPTSYRLKVKMPGRDQSSSFNVDLLETFNFLLGLSIESITAPRQFDAQSERDHRGRLQVSSFKQSGDGPHWFRTVVGRDFAGRNVLVIWRKRLDSDTPEGIELDNSVLDYWFTNKQQYSVREGEFDLIYVNGDNNLENLRRSDETWKVRLIEEEFHRLMFDTGGMP